MASIITIGATTIRPDLILGYETERPSRNIVHRLLGPSVVAVSLRPAGLRSGSLRLFFADEAGAVACEAAHARQGTCTLADPDFPSIAMRYVLDGRLGRNLEPDSDQWVVTVGYQEIDA